MHSSEDPLLGFNFNAFMITLVLLFETDWKK